MSIEVKAPANVKISGEHSVVYGGPSLSAAIGIYATARVDDTSSDKLEVVLQDLNISASFDATTLRRLYDQYGKRDVNPPKDPSAQTALARYISENSGIGKEMLPYATIAARLLVEHGVSPTGKRVTIHSEVPIQKGYASSAVCSTSFTMALVKSAGIQLDDQTAIDIARDGERIVHKAETAGRMDVGPAYYGGYAVFSAATGIVSEPISTQINVVVIDTGPKPPTAEMVKKVRDMYNSDTDGTTKRLREIDDCVTRCIEALKKGDMRELGRQMSRNHELLKTLGVSSDRLDNAVAVAMSNGALGAKLCGGGGGGMGIALVGSDADAVKVINALKEKGFESFKTSITLEGAKSSGRIRNKI